MPVRMEPLNSSKPTYLVQHAVHSLPSLQQPATPSRSELTQVVAPNLRAFLYTWGAGRVTREGEHVPVRMEPLNISDPTDLLLLLPVTAEHTIDERSPLFGHTHESLTVRPACLPSSLLDPWWNTCGHAPEHH